MTDIFKRVKQLGRKQKNERHSIYSMVSCSDLTPGSLEVWVDLPDDIKFDPSLAPFKRLYEQRHGKVETHTSPEAVHGDKTIFNRIHELAPIDEDLDQENNLASKDNRHNSKEVEDTDNNKKPKSSLNKQRERACRAVKLTALVACWVLLTVSLLLNTELAEVVLQVSVQAEQVKEYKLDDTNDSFSVLVTLRGPFAEVLPNSTDNGELHIWLHRTTQHHQGPLYQQNSTLWKVRLQPDDLIDFSQSAIATKKLVIDNQDWLLRENGNISDSSNATLREEHEKLFAQNFMNEISTNVTLQLHSSANVPVPLTLVYQLNPLKEEVGLIYASLLLCTLYALIIFEIVNRTIAAVLCSSLAIAVLALSGIRPSLPELVSWLDVETLLLLFSMMILVAILAETGLFDYLAVIAFEVTGGRTWPLINCLCFFTALFSTFLDNVTTVLLMTPVTIRLCEVMYLNPIPVLMSMVIFSNVGGSATPVGDPPNVIIASHPSVLQENINFVTFTIHMGLGILIVCIQTYIQLRFMFRDMNKLRHSVPRDIQEMRQEIFAWKRAAGSLSSYSRDEDIVRKALEKQAEKLIKVLKKKEAGKGSSKADPLFCSTLAQMKEKYKIRDKELLIKSTVCVSFVIIVFFLHAIPQLQRLSLGWTAFLGALLLLLLAERDDLEPILARVEWSTLLFFAALFVLMEALSKLGLISWIGNVTESLILRVNEESRLMVAILLVLWVSGLTSAFVDNIPLTTMMVRVTAALADPKGLGLPLAPLAWALSFGACLGGNGTLIGASANVVCAGVAEQHGYRFTFLQYLKIGFPIMIGNLIVASVYLLFCHSVFQWH